MEEERAVCASRVARSDATLLISTAAACADEIVTNPICDRPPTPRLLQQLRETLVALGVNDGNMEEGSWRCDAAKSPRRGGLTTLGTNRGQK